MTITIDVTHPQKLDSLARPKNWTEAVSHLNVSEPTVKKCREALGSVDALLTPELFEEIRRMVRFCEKRNSGGGGTCNRRNYVMLKNQGQEVLEARLKTLGII